MENETLVDEYEVVRDGAARVFGTLVDALKASTAESPQETDQLTSSISALSKASPLLTREVQVNSLLFYNI